MKFLKTLLIVLIPLPFTIAAQVSAFTHHHHKKASPNHKKASSTEGHNDANRHMHQVNFETLLKHFEDPEREIWQRPELVIQIINDLAGGTLNDMTVADIGAGSGYFTFRLAEICKKVIAIDIDDRFLNYIQSKNDSLKLPIETRLVSENNPKLKKGEADIVLTVNTYHHINNRTEYFRDVREKLRTEGALVVVDFKKEEMPVGPPMRMKLTAEEVADELKQAGFQSIEKDQNSLEYQYVVIAK
jgi:2-polyprenyl-3-methyl-5-hydroxy-6-metoxy-1,4-benzoquinol methylase